MQHTVCGPPQVAGAALCHAGWILLVGLGNADGLAIFALDRLDGLLGTGTLRKPVGVVALKHDDDDEDDHQDDPDEGSAEEPVEEAQHHIQNDLDGDAFGIHLGELGQHCQDTHHKASEDDQLPVYPEQGNDERYNHHKPDEYCVVPWPSGHVLLAEAAVCVSDLPHDVADALDELLGGVADALAELLSGVADALDVSLDAHN